MRPKDRLIVARIGAAHGVKGELRLKSYTELPADVVRYAPLLADDGRSFEIESIRPAAGTSADTFVVRLKGIADRDAAAALTGLDLWIARDRLPPTDKDEFYHADLIGLSAVTPAGKTLGTVVAVENFGAGDLIEVAPPDGNTFLVPFTKAVVPSVDIAAGRLVVDAPAGLIDEDDTADQAITGRKKH